MTIERNPDPRLDQLMMELAHFIDDWDVDDVARICGAMAAVAAAMPKNLTSDQRRENFVEIMTFMRTVFEDKLSEFGPQQ